MRGKLAMSKKLAAATVLAALNLLVGSAVMAAQVAWPEYRGPTSDGHATATDLPITWSETDHIRFKTFIHDKGWSSPVIVGNQIWMTTARADGHAMYVVCVDRKDGSIRFDKKIFDVPHPRPLGNELNSYASPSPTVEPGRVYVHFGSYGTACLDTETCQLIWQRRDLPCNHYRGPGSSPILFEGLLIFHMDGSDYQYVVALDKTTGRTVWKTDRSTDYGDLDASGRPIRDGDFRKAFNTPRIIRVGGQLQLISPSAKAIYAYDPRTGREQWQVRHHGHSTAARPLYDGTFCYVSTGLGQSELLAIDPHGAGDITATHVRWRRHRQVPKRSSPVLVDGLIYGCTNNGIAFCLEARSGKLIWQHRLRGEFSASPLYADGHLYFCNQDGATIVVRPARTYDELARNRLDDGCMASPAAVDRAIYLRTKSHLYRIERPAGGAAPAASK